MMRKEMMAIALSGMLFFSSACGVFSYHHTSTGAEITDEQLKQIQPGMSSDEVIVLLGTPTEVKKLSDGRKVYVYRWQRGSSASFLWGTIGTSGAKAYYVTVIFDKENKVQRVGKGKGGPAEVTPTFKIKEEKVATPTAEPAL